MKKLVLIKTLPNIKKNIRVLGAKTNIQQLKSKLLNSNEVSKFISQHLQERYNKSSDISRLDIHTQLTATWRTSGLGVKSVQCVNIISLVAPLQPLPATDGSAPVYAHNQKSSEYEIKGFWHKICGRSQQLKGKIKNKNDLTYTF